MNVQHSSREDSWRTPSWVVEKARLVLGTIDMDPASDPEANKLIRAKRIITRESDGLAASWAPDDLPITIWLNPPGGKRGSRSLTALFWQKLMAQVSSGLVRDAIFMAFSAGALQNTQGKGCPALGDWLVCIPSKRIKFDHPTEVKVAPSHSNVIAYVRGTLDRSESFVRNFSDVGTIMRGQYAR